MIDLILVLILLAVGGGSLWYLLRAKKRGQTCVGCPYSGKCSGNCEKK